MIPDENTTIMTPRPENIPAELKERDQWVVWRLEEQDSRLTKVPYGPRTGRKASSTDSLDWSTFEEAVAAYERDGRYSGIGFVFTSGDPFTGIDLDDCCDSETGELFEWAQHWVDLFDSYTELSPTGRGVHIIVRGKTPHNGRRTKDGKTVEIYSTERYFTVTGAKL